LLKQKILFLAVFFKRHLFSAVNYNSFEMRAHPVIAEVYSRALREVMKTNHGVTKPLTGVTEVQLRITDAHRGMAEATLGLQSLTLEM
jgi:hypothetical protein